MIEAPASKAARATFDCVVSILIGVLVVLIFAASWVMTGITRAICSSGGTREAPGRVDSPPISIMSTPWSIICWAWARAESGVEYKLPSEKLSGVRLRTPTTRGVSSENGVAELGRSRCMVLVWRGG